MTERASTGILAAIFLVLLCITVRAYFFAPSRGAGPAVRTSLVKPSEKYGISSIVIMSWERSVELVRRDGDWFIRQGRIFYPASARKVGAFLDELTKERSVMPIAKTGGADFGIGNPGVASVRLRKDDGTIVADIDFGDVNAAGTDIYFRTGRDIAVLQTADAFTPSLDARTASWAELSPYSALTRQAAIQRVEYERIGEKSIIFRAGKESEGVAAFSAALESLVCLDIDGNFDSTAMADERIGVELGNLDSFSVAFVRRDDGDFVMMDSRSGLAYIVGKWSHDRLVETLAK